MTPWIPFLHQEGYLYFLWMIEKMEVTIALEEYVGLITHITRIKTIMVGTITIKAANLKCFKVLIILRSNSVKKDYP